jgi:hypothetical protein
VLDPFEPEPATFFAIHPVSSAQSRKIALFVDELATTLKGLPRGSEMSAFRGRPEVIGARSE